MSNYVANTDPEIASIIEQEAERQESGLELIASENSVSRSVMEVQGSVLTNKYAEGYPAKRYYGGCAFVDAAEALLGQADITVNKNSIPFETRSPFVTSGVRLGTPAITSRGIKPEQAGIIARLISNILKNPGDDAVIQNSKKEVEDLCKAFPLYKNGGAS